MNRNPPLAHRWSLLLFVFCVAQVAAQKNPAPAEEEIRIKALKFKQIVEVPHNLQVGGTTLGGLSGIDYNPDKEEYYFICDDRSNINPVRFYTAKINWAADSIAAVSFTGVTILRRPNGDTFPGYYKNAHLAVDPESMRFNRTTRQFVWASEGDNAKDKNGNVVNQVDPAIYMADSTGRAKDSLDMPAVLRMAMRSDVPRENGVLEAIAFSKDFKKLFVSVEEPLVQDGPQVDVFPQDTYLRFFRFDMATKQNDAQWAYMPDPIPYVASPPNGYKVNGVSEIAYLGNNNFLVVERSFVTGRGFGAKIFLANSRYATSVLGRNSLVIEPPFSTMSKKLLFDTKDLAPRYIDNIEGITIGPKLSNGHYSLLLVTDNNFTNEEKTQVFLFDIIPPQ